MSFGYAFFATVIILGYVLAHAASVWLTLGAAPEPDNRLCRNLLWRDVGGAAQPLRAAAIAAECAGRGVRVGCAGGAGKPFRAAATAAAVELTLSQPNGLL